MKKQKVNYIDTIYDENRTPQTNYPSQLISYLKNEFSLNKGSKLLELGCGRGDFLHEFQNLGFDCYGVDREKSKFHDDYNLNVSECDLEKDNLPFDDNEFDIVYHKSVIEHVNNPSKIMMETKRVLKKDGVVIILTPDWHTQWKNFYEDFTHSRPYDKLTMKDLLEIYSFSNVQVKKFIQLPIIWKYPFLSIISKVLRIFMDVYTARWLTQKTKVKFFRWSCELMILGYGRNEK